MKSLENYIKENLRDDFKYDETNECNIFEMARMDEPHFRNGLEAQEEIWIYGRDRETLTPHFHYKDGDEVGHGNKKHKEYELEISISGLNVINIKYDKKSRLNGIVSNWSESKLRKRLQSWLKAINPQTNNTNELDIMMEWNRNNPNNRVKILVSIREISSGELETTENVDYEHSFGFYDEYDKLASYILIGKKQLTDISDSEEYKEIDNPHEIIDFTISDKSHLNKIINEISKSYNMDDCTLWYVIKDTNINAVCKTLKGYSIDNKIVLKNI